ncbi:hypothetical protein AKJ16_DCAP24811 [Drosera capensis]
MEAPPSMSAPAGPSSSPSSPVELGDCIDALVEFVLRSAVDGTLGLDFGLSAADSLSLLKEDPHHNYHDLVIPRAADHSDMRQGTLKSPLYKPLASALRQWIVSGACPYEDVLLNHKDASLKDLQDWNELVVGKEDELTRFLKRINFELHVQEPFFSQLKDGLKTVEGRCAVGHYCRIESGALLFFNKCLVLEVQEVHHYATFAEMLEAVSLEKILPGVLTIQEGVSIYRRFYTEEMEVSNGVLAFCVQRSDYQPYITLADIISGLRYKGIQALLSLENAAESVSQELGWGRWQILTIR